MQKILLDCLMLLIALVHLIWPAQIAEFNNQRSFFSKNPWTVRNTRMFGVFLLMLDFIAIWAH